MERRYLTDVLFTDLPGDLRSGIIVETVSPAHHIPADVPYYFFLKSFWCEDYQSGLSNISTYRRNLLILPPTTLIAAEIVYNMMTVEDCSFAPVLENDESFMIVSCYIHENDSYHLIYEITADRLSISDSPDADIEWLNANIFQDCPITEADLEYFDTHKK